MKQLICEMCGNTDLVKQDGVFVCQGCGLKYSVEEAKKIMGAEPIAIVGTVTIDNSAAYDRILSLARDAYNDKRFEAAYNYYCQAVEIRPDEIECVLRQGLSILAKDGVQSQVPSSCVSRVNRAVELIKAIPNGEEKSTIVVESLTSINIACQAVENDINDDIEELQQQKQETRSAGEILTDFVGTPAFIAAQKSADDERINRLNSLIDGKIEALKECQETVFDFRSKYETILLPLANVNDQFIYYYRKDTASSMDELVRLYPLITLSKEEQKKLTEENNYMQWAASEDNVELVRVLIQMGCDVNKTDSDELSPLFMACAYKPKDEEQKHKCIAIARMLLDNGADIDLNEHNDRGRYLVNTDTPQEILQMLIAKKPEVQYHIAQAPKSSGGGCYVATAVYGSYDCPEVWTLRRYRDSTLSETWYGRTFIRTYYAVSPTLVKWFGHTAWFKNMWKGKLDRMVADLQRNGVESTPYEDRNW